MKKINRLFYYLILIGLFVIIIFQANLNWQSYVRPWLEQYKGYILVSSAQRSAILTMGRERARFMRFLDAYLPEDAAIVLPGNTVFFSSQSLMQNFLFPRPILACCGGNNDLCKKCLEDPHNFILAVNSFPLPEEQPGRVFVSYPQATNSLRGVYVPTDMVQKLAIPDQNEYGKTIPISVRALLTDILIIGLLFLLGSLLVFDILNEPVWADLLELSIPLSMGFISWAMFLLSYFGLPLALVTVVILFFLLLILAIGIHYFINKSLPLFPEISWRGVNSQWKFTDGLFLLLLLFAVVLFGVVIFISIGRGYSTGDDIINWSFKGYAMADSGTIWAAERWGGHVLAYPMNLTLSIGIFRLADGDIIPGSKFLYILLTFSLLFGCYRFLLRNHVDKLWAIAGVIALLSVPLFFFHATSGLANLPFTVYLTLGVLYSLEGIRDSKIPQTLLGGILLALAAWTRPEGILFGLAFLVLIFILAYFILKSHISFKLAFASFLPMLIIPGSWMFLLGVKGMNSDQIGGALKAFLNEVMRGNFYFDSIRVIIEYARRTFYTIPFVLLIVAVVVIIITIPLTKWYKDKFKLSLFALDVLAFLLPGMMFFIASFNESDFMAFLDQSFDRAFLPALTMTMLVAILAVTNKAVNNELITFQ